jgi:hypothetical protein
MANIDINEDAIRIYCMHYCTYITAEILDVTLYKWLPTYDPRHHCRNFEHLKLDWPNCGNFFLVTSNNNNCDLYSFFYCFTDFKTKNWHLHGGRNQTFLDPNLLC